MATGLSYSASDQHPKLLMSGHSPSVLRPGRSAQPLPSLGISSRGRSGDSDTLRTLGKGFSFGADNNLTARNLFLVREATGPVDKSAGDGTSNGF